MTFVLDASAVFRYSDNETGAARVEELLNLALLGKVHLLLSAVNWGEIAGILFKRHGRADARRIAGNLTALPIAIVPVDKADAEGAGIFKQEHGVPYADAHAGFLAQRESATLVTADFDFKKIPSGVISVEFLAGKPGRSGVV